MNREQLEAMAAEKMAQEEAQTTSSPSRADLEQLAALKMAQEEETGSAVDAYQPNAGGGYGLSSQAPQQEASLGVVNRARYAIEPLESNRRALLAQEYGPENIFEDGQGNTYLKQNGQYLPVNKPGFSVADAANFAGAIPEVAGASAGALMGLGPASIPFAAVGGAAGSAIRQGASALLGTPQVATPMERLTEAGTSAAFSAAGAGAGKLIKAGAKEVTPAAKGALERFKSLFNKSPVSTATTTTGEATQLLGGTLENAAKSADDIAGQIADQSGRDIVSNEAERLNRIALEQGLPAPTYAQTAGGNAILAEGQILDTPIIGNATRKYVDKQLGGVQKNLEKDFGNFLETVPDAFETGLVTKELANTSLRAQKQVASELYDQVGELGANAALGKRTFFNKFRDFAGDHGLINPDLTRAAYAAETELTRAEFNTVQGAIFDGLDAIKRSESSKINFKAVNAVRKTLRNTAEELKISNPNASRILNRFAKDLEKTAEGVLNREHPKLGKIFSEANRRYAKFKGHEEFYDKIFKEGVGDERVIATVMSDSAKVEGLKQIIGPQSVDGIGKAYVADLLQSLGKSGVGRADTLITKLKSARVGAPVRAAIGDKAYNNLLNNLYYLNRLNQPLGVSRKSLLGIAFEQGGFRRLGLSLAGSAKTYATSKGLNSTEVQKKAVKEFSGKTFDAISRKVNSKNVGRAANVLTDEKQRAAAFFTRGPQSSVSQIEEEKKKRKRAISGEKQ